MIKEKSIRKPYQKKKNKFKISCPNIFNPTFKKKKTCFVCEKSGHHAHQWHKVNNDNIP